MKPRTVENAKAMLTMLLEEGASYAEAGKPFGLVRSTVERNVKNLLRDLVRSGCIAGLDEDGLTSFALVRKASDEVLRALGSYEPRPQVKPMISITDVDLEQARSRLRRRSQNAQRDLALIAVLFQTGAKPVEVARLEVGDYLNADGTVRTEARMRCEAAANRRARPIYFSSISVRAAVDDYLLERTKRSIGRGKSSDYRGLDPHSALFLTANGIGFEIRPRNARDTRETCPLMTATLRLAFRRAGWSGLTAQAVRRMVTRRLFENGAQLDQVAQLLGLTSERAVLRLLANERRPLVSITQTLV